MPMVETRAGPIAYEEQGHGVHVVLLHATLHDRHDYDPIVPALARHRRVIAIDWPGHGEAPAPVIAPTAAGLADALEDVVAALDLPPAVLIGNSVGGFAASRLAIRQPERVAGLVLVNSGGFIPTSPVTRAFCRFMGTPAITRRVLPFYVRSYMQAQSESDRVVRDRGIARARTKDGASTAASLWRSFASTDHDLRPEADRLTAPTLIVWGAKDTALRLRIGHATRDAISGAQFETLPTGHVVFSSMPDAFLSIVEPFLDRVAPA